MAGELVSGYLRLIPTVDGIQGATARALVPATREADKAGKVAGRRFGAAFGLSSKKLLLGGALVAGIGAGAKALGEFTKNAALDEAGQRRLARSLKNTTSATKKQVAGVEDWISAQGVALGVTDDELRPSFQRLVQATGNIGKAQKLAKVAMDASAGSGKSLETVSTALAKAQNGNLSALSRLGLKIKDSTGKALTFTQAVKEMARTFGGQAKDRAQAFEGQMARFRLIVDEGKEAIGLRLIPILTKLGGWFLDKGLPAVGRFADSLTKTLSPAYTSLRDTIANSPLAQSIKSGLAGALDDAGASLDTLREKFKGFDFSNLDGKKLGETIGTALGEAIKGIGKLGGKIADAIGKLFGSIDWVGLGISAGKQAPAFLLGLVTGIITFDPGALFSSMAKHWKDILIGVLIVAFAPVKLVGPIAKIFGKIPFVGKFIESALKGLNSAGGKIKSALGDMAKGFAEGFGRLNIPGAGLVSKIIGVFRGLPARLKSFFGTIGTAIYVYGVNLAKSLGAGLRSAPGRVAAALSKIWPQAQSAVKSLGDRLVNYIATFPGRIGRLGSKFLSAGKGLITKFVDGMKNAGGIIEGIAGNVWKALKKLLNAAIDKINEATKFKITAAGKTLVDFGGTRIPHLASGGRATGAMLAVIGEGREPETVLPDSMLSGLVGRIAAQGRAAEALRASPAGSGGPRRVAMTITNWREGTGYFEEIADDQIGRQLAFAGVMERMGG